MESVTLTLSDKTSSLEVYYFPPIELSPNKNYVLGLTEFLTFHSIPNVDESNNKFHVGSRIITIPTGSYEIEDLEKYLKNQLSEKISFSLKPNNNTLTSVIKCSEEIDFTPKNSIGQLLGFTERKLERDTEHNSDLSVKILRVNSLRIECNITTGAYINNQSVHTIHQFFPRVPPGYKIIETPSPIIYLPILNKSIDYIQIRVVDQDGHLVNFQGEVITVRLHIKPVT